MIRRPADNTVLDFIEQNEMKRRIKVISTEDEDRFKVIRGLSAKNQVVDTTYMSGTELKQLWIDSVVNGYECVKNEIFMRGIKDCFPEPKPTEEEIIKEELEINLTRRAAQFPLGYEDNFQTQFAKDLIYSA
jgi:hypothetical protein